MRIFHAIVAPEPLFVRAAESQLSERRSIGAQLVGDQQLGCEALLLEQLAHQPQRRPAVAPTLNQHVENLALVIDRAPEIHPLTGDGYHQASGRGAVASPRSLRTGRDTLASSGSHCSAASIEQTPVSKQPRLMACDARQPVSGSPLVPA